ncbi:DEAD/DEAH box helicase [Spongorhabdus nitratireducens]
MYKLRPYQNESVSRILQTVSSGFESHSVAVLGTGAGKSIIIAEVIKRLSKKVLVVSRNKEICQQNAQKYLDVTGKYPSIYNAGLNQKSLHMDAVFASAQSLVNLDERAYPRFDLIIIDECHQWGLEEGSATIQAKHIVSACKKVNPVVPVVGLTATPFRLKANPQGSDYFNWPIYEGKEAFFKKCLIDISEETLTAQGYLSPIEYVNDAKTLFVARGAYVSSNDFKENEIARICDVDTKIRASVARIIRNADQRNGGCIIFAATRYQARMIYEIIPSSSKACIFGDTNTSLRDSYIKKFKNGDIKYLVNVLVLTTGFDAPNITTLAILRPTASYSLFRQIIGRGMRLHPGKKSCLLMDFTDNVERFSEDADLSALLGNKIGKGELSLPIEHRSISEKKNEKIICPTCQFANLSNSDKCLNLIKGQDGEYKFCDTYLEPKKCKFCGQINPKSSDFCSGCESSINSIDTCNYCKHETPKNAPFCLMCGMSNTENFELIRDAARLAKSYRGEPVYKCVVGSDKLKFLTDFSILFHIDVNGKTYSSYAAGDIFQFISTLAPVLDMLGILKQCRMASIRDKSGVVLKNILHLNAEKIRNNSKYLYHSLSKKIGSDEVIPRVVSIDYC